MRIVFDHQIFCLQKYGGFSRYFVSLARELRKRTDDSADIVAPGHVCEYLRREDLANPVSFRQLWPQRGLRYRPALYGPLFWLEAVRRTPSIVHETHYLLGGVHVPSKVPIVATCHDMIIEQCVASSSTAGHEVEQKRRALERSRAIICISGHTRNELLRYYPQYSPKVTVVHHGTSFPLQPAQETRLVPDPYILFVGMRRGYKNFGNLLLAYGGSRHICNNFKLVCFGGGPFTAAEMQACDDHGVKRERLFHCSGGDEDLARAYRDAALFVFPSKYEGFGMPLTEAMAQRCPVACSQASCFPEICGDAAVFFDPDCPTHIAEVMESVLFDSDFAARMRRRGEERARHFTWERCASQTYEVYRRVQEGGV